VPYSDPAMYGDAGEGTGRSALLFGRRTYEKFYSYWPTAPQPNPFTDLLNNAEKFVASTTLTEPLPWVNSTLLGADVPDAVARLKEQPGNDLVILGSGELIQSLMPHNLIDEYRLLIHPLVLGSGRHLFPEDGSYASLRLVTTATTSTGVVMATYRQAGNSQAPGSKPYGATT